MQAERRSDGSGQAQPGRIVMCLCRHAHVVDEGASRRVRAHLDGAGVPYDVVEDLCGLAGRRDPVLKEIASSPSLCIVACYPRAVQALFEFAGAPLDEERCVILNARADDIGRVVSSLPAAAADRLSDRPLDAEADDDWVPWFPVIDSALCRHCRKCLSFCLFGVFALDASDRVVVVNPSQCKLNCPACARVCPDAAIIFPKYKAAPFNGAEVGEQDHRDEPARVDVSKLVEGDVYAAIRRRSVKGRRVGRNGRAPAQPSGAERLAELKEQLDIPDEVIDSIMGKPKSRDDRR